MPPNRGAVAGPVALGIREKTRRHHVHRHGRVHLYFSKGRGTSLRLPEDHRNVLRTFFPKYNGKGIKTMGDSFLVEFASALEAARCALDIQLKLHEGNIVLPSENCVGVRASIHLGDVVHIADGDVQGDVASRIEPLADPGWNMY